MQLLYQERGSSAACKCKVAFYQESSKDKQGFTKEDALIAVLEHVECNGCDFELTLDEYNELKNSF